MISQHQTRRTLSQMALTAMVLCLAIMAAAQPTDLVGRQYRGLLTDTSGESTPFTALFVNEFEVQLTFRQFPITNGPTPFTLPDRESMVLMGLYSFPNSPDTDSVEIEASLAGGPIFSGGIVGGVALESLRITTPSADPLNVNANRSRIFGSTIAIVEFDVPVIGTAKDLAEVIGSPNAARQSFQQEVTLLMDQDCAVPVSANGYDITFSGEDECWEGVGLPGIFDVPAFTQAGDPLRVSAGGSTNAFGFWTSPALTVSPNFLYEIRWELRSSVAPELVPEIRLRVAESGNRHAELKVISSAGDGAFSPGGTPVIYSQFYRPAEFETDITLNLDILSFDPTNDPNAVIDLLSVNILGHFTGP